MNKYVSFTNKNILTLRETLDDTNVSVDEYTAPRIDFTVLILRNI